MVVDLDACLREEGCAACTKACHDSPEYQAAARIRDEASTADLVIIEGYEG